VATGWAVDLTNPLDPTVVVEGQTLTQVDRITVDWRRGQVARIYLEAATPGVLDGLGPVMEHPRDTDERPALLALLNDLDPDALEKMVRESGSLGDSIGASFLAAIKTLVAGNG
jgi:hypothetical protein